MNFTKTVFALILSLFLIFLSQVTHACSMYKVTHEGNTMVGCNEDAWRTTPRIWFENSTNKNEYGAGFTGSRIVGANKFAPQSGMNEVGLVFSRLSAYYPKKNRNITGKKIINDEVQYLTDILHKCKTIDEVEQFIEAYDYSYFLTDVFVYVDKSGDYLVVEPYQLIKGSDPSYVQANFCPSITDPPSARKQMRYKNGVDYVNSNRVDTALSFYVAMSDTMHVCRSRNGDGTLLTSLWNTEKGLVNLYFYHNYDSTVQFDLAKELALGNHILEIPSLFPVNPEFEQLVNYKTPFNVSSLRLILVLIGGLLLLLSFVNVISYIRNRNKDDFNPVKLVFSGLNLLLMGYMFVLATNIGIYYFDAPYQHYASDLISLSSYIPFVLLVLIAPVTYYNFRYFQANAKSNWVKGSLVFNNLLFMVLIIGFGYWGLFHVIN